MSTYKAVTEVFSGINRLEKVNDGEFKSCINVLSDQYPAINCGVGCESVVTSDKKILKAFPNFNSGQDYMGFEGICEDGSLEYYYLSSDYTLKKNTVSLGTSTEVFRIGHDYYSIKDYLRTNSFGVYAGDSPGDTVTDITGKRVRFAGTVGVNDDGTQVVFTSSSALSISLSVGDVVAFSLSEEYLASNSGAKYLDTFTYNYNNVYSYTVTSVSSTKFTCKAVKYNGDAFKLSGEYKFVLTDYCYISKKYPKFSWLCSHLNRAAGVTVDGGMIMISKPGSYSVFYDYSGEATDSYSVEVADNEPFNGCISYDSMLVVFKSGCMYGLYGDVPENFQLLQISADVGCIDPYSMSVCSGSLYFLSTDGFYRYSGGKPVCISRKLGKKYKSAKCCAGGRKYYALCVDEEDNKELLCFDTELGIWYGLSYLPNDIFCQNNKLYMVYDYEITRLNSQGSDWLLESGIISDDIFNDRAVTELYIRIRNADEDTFLNVYTADENNDFIPHITVSGRGFHEFYIPVRFKEGKAFRYKLEGSGKCVITDIRRIYAAVE